MNLFPKYKEYRLEIVYNENLFEKTNVEVVLSAHGESRSKERDNKPVHIPKTLIDNIIRVATPKIIDFSKYYKKFVIHDKSTQLNIVGELFPSTKRDLLKFYVATVMYKARFIPKNQDDKFIAVSLG